MREDAEDEDDPEGAFWDYMYDTPTLRIMVGDYFENIIHDLSEGEISLILGEEDEDDDVETLDVKDLIVKAYMEYTDQSFAFQTDIKDVCNMTHYETSFIQVLKMV